jgi:NDP-sugar pyrophosphorylase family protein
MRAVILTGGKGTRLRPYTATLPKPLVPVGERAILDIILLQLSHFGVTHVSMAVNHLKYLIMAYFGDGSERGLRIDYSAEDKPLSTIAPLKLIPDLPETFIVMNGDVLTDIDYALLYQNHLESGADVTVATFQRDSKIDFGVLESDDDGQIAGFREKPVYHFQVSMGVYVLNRRVLDFVPDGEPYGFDDLMYAAVDGKLTARVFAHDGYWLDIGRPDDYAEANENVEDLMKILLPSG